jgi:plastocyanin
VTGATGGSGPPPANAQVDMPGTSFEPNAVTIAQGGTISFVFTALGHDVIFGAGSGVQDIPVTTGQTVSRTFNTKGTFGMNCTVHPGMSGTVTVQ